MTRDRRRTVAFTVEKWIRKALLIMLLATLGGCGEGPPESAVGEDEAGDVTEGQVPSADGVPIHYQVQGAGEPAIVLVHGWANSMAIWGEHPRTLSANHRVVNLELAGHGQSGTDRDEWTMGAFGDDVVAVVDRLGLDEVVLVGFSLGGAVVIEAARRLGDRALGVVLVDAFHDPGLAWSVAEAEEFEGMIRANWGTAEFIRAFAFMPDAPDSLIDLVVRQNPEEPYDHLFAAFWEWRDWSEFEVQPAIAQLEAPIAAINTTEPPTNVEAWRALAPGFTADTLSGLGHAGVLLRRVADFDALLLALVDRFAAGGSGETSR